MSTESAGSALLAQAPAAAPVKLPNTLTLTREALYMLEACLRQMAGVTSMQQSVLWDKVQRKCRRTNDRKVKVSWDPAGHDFETKLLRNDGEGDLPWAKRNKEWEEAMKSWQEEAVELGLSNKHFTAAKDAVKFVFENGYKEGSKCQVQLPLNQHTSALLIELKLADAEPDEE